jgi:hypothetical protein
VELGHLLLVTFNQYQFIVDYKVMEKQRDASQVSVLWERIKKYYPEEKIKSHCFDKGFWSKDNLTTLQGAGIEQIILPKKAGITKRIKNGKAIPDLKSSAKHITQLRAISTCWNIMASNVLWTKDYTALKDTEG